MLFAVVISWSQPLNGNYTVGGTSPDYITVSDAVTDLNSSGVDGPVKFIIRDGSYVNSIQIINVSGVSATNTVTFESESLDSTKVYITVSGGSQPTVQITNTEHVIFRKVTLEKTGGSFNGIVLMIDSNIGNITVEGCRLSGVTVTGESTTKDVVQVGYMTENIVIKNSRIINGHFGIFVDGNISASRWLNISDNIFEQQYNAAIKISTAENITISHNKITIPEQGSNSSSHGMILDNVSFNNIYTGSVIIQNNDIITGATYAGMDYSGIKLSNCNGSVIDSFLVANNTVIIESSQGAYGIEIDKSDYISFYHNSIQVSTSMSTYGVPMRIDAVTQGSSFLQILNNIFYNHLSYPAMYVNDPDVINICDYNDYFVDIGDLILTNVLGYFTDLASWNAAIGIDYNSLNVHPGFWDETLHTKSPDLDSAGTPVAIVQYDMDGEKRKIDYPDIGADEFVHIPFMNDSTFCFGEEVFLDAGNPGSSYLWSPGNETTQVISVTTEGAYSVIVTEPGGGPTATDTINIGYYPEIIVDTLNNFDITCFGMNDGSIDITVTGGMAPYFFLWSSGQNTEDIMSLVPGLYTVTVTDDKGCTATPEIQISEPPQLVINTESATDINCFGNNDGTITASATGGTPPLMYDIGFGTQTTGDFYDLSFGTYIVTVTDNSGCFIVGGTLTINEPDQLFFDVPTTSDPLCFGDCDGTGTVSLSGGVSPYTYAWSDPGTQTTSTATGLCSGDYTVEGTDYNGCTAYTSITIVEPPQLSITNESWSDPLCYGGNDGYVDVETSGGTGILSYDIGTGSQTNGDFFTLTAGTYTCTVTDDYGCTVTSSDMTLNEPPEIILNVTHNNPTCYLACDGTATADVSGGTPPYSFIWDDGLFQTTQTAYDLPPGNTGVTVTDNQGCTASGSTLLTDPPELVINSETPTDVSCFGGNDGTVTIDASGGTPPYLYNLGFGTQANNNFTDLTAGVYYSEVTDNNGCNVYGSGVEIYEPTQLIISSGHTDANCGMPNGDATVTPSGGTPPYTYEWSTGGTADMITGIPAGVYAVTVTDFNGCPGVTTVDVGDTGGPDASIGGVTDVSCTGYSDGSATVSVTSGTPPYTYLWNTGETLATISGVVSDTYFVTVTDDVGCMDAISISVGSPPALDLSINFYDPLCNGSCDGELEVIANGGTPGYLYEWSSGPTDSYINGLCSGTYEVTVTDMNGCTSVTNHTLNDPPLLTIDSETPSDVLCYGSIDGAITATASGGSGQLTYSIVGATQDNGNFFNLGAGTYYLTVTDENGCTVEGTGLTINEPIQLTISPSSTNVTCYADCDGTTTASPSGGTPPYMYQWDDPTWQTSQTAISLCAGSYYVTVTDNNGCTEMANTIVTEPPQLTIDSEAPSDVTPCYGNANGSLSIIASGGTGGLTYDIGAGQQAGETFTNLSPGDYTVTVADANGCTVTGGVNTINEPAQIIISDITANVYPCNGDANGSIDLAVSGGEPGYMYIWSSGQSMEDIAGLSGGEYIVSVTDAIGCTVSDTFNIQEPDLITILTENVTNIICFGDSDGTVSVTASGGTTPLSYDIGAGPQAGGSFTNLGVGTYQVTITDANGCSDISTLLTVTEPPQLIIDSESSTDITCFGDNDGTIIVTASGGAGTLNYDIGSGTQASGTFTSLAAGDYTMTITDANGCTAESNIFTIEEPAVINVTTAGTDISCYGLCDGIASVSVISGGTPSYSYEWDDPLYQTNSSATDLCSGSYNLTVTDANGCTGISNVIITEPAQLVLDSESSTDITCFGDNNGTVLVTVTGGAAPLSYDLGAGAQADGNFTVLSVGDYVVTVTDANGCSIESSTLPVSEPPEVSITTESYTDITCYGMADGTISIVASGGIPTLMYDLAGSPQATGDFTDLTAGSYTVTVSDANGCTTVSSTFTITDPDALVIDSENSTDVAPCYGDDNGILLVVASGGTPPLTYDIGAGGQANGNFFDLTPGTYTVTVTDANGCFVNATPTDINEPSQIMISSENSTDISPCYGDANGTVTITASGGTPPLSYDIGTGTQSTGDFTGLSSGTYTVTVTDNAGCTSIGSALTVNEPTDIVIDSESSTEVTPCYGSANGTVTVTASGGTGSLYYDIGGGQQVSGDFTNLSGGDYIVTVTDDNGCTKETSVITVNEPAELVINYQNYTVITCNNGNDGTITVSATGGTPPLLFDIGAGTQGTGDFTGLAAGTYTVTVTDNNGCTVITNPTDLANPSAIVITNVVTDASCDIEDGAIDISVTGGWGSYSYLWSNGEPTQDITGLGGGQYTVSVTDIVGCMETDIIDVGAEPLSSVTGTVDYSGGTFDPGDVTVELFIESDSAGASNMQLIGYVSNSVSGQFAFNDLPSGIYYVRAHVNDQALFPYVLPSYYDSAMSWSEAIAMDISCDSNAVIEFTMAELIPPTQGEGIISGNIKYLNLGSKDKGEPVPGADIYLEQEPDDDPVAHTESDSTGAYMLEEIPSGDGYKLYVDIPGYPMLSTFEEISVSESDTLIENMNFYVDTTSEGGIYIDSTALNVIEYLTDNYSVTLFPNPYTEYINICYTLNSTSDVYIEIYDIHGRPVEVIVAEKQGTGDYSHTFSAENNGLQPGTYIIRLRFDNTVYIRKIIEF